MVVVGAVLAAPWSIGWGALPCSSVVARPVEIEVGQSTSLYLDTLGMSRYNWLRPGDSRWREKEKGEIRIKESVRLVEVATCD